MRRLFLGRNRSALTAIVLAMVLPGCCWCGPKRFGGPWPFGTDETADIAKYGPVAVQRVDEIKTKAKKAASGNRQEQEAFAADMAKRMQQETNCTVRMAIVASLADIKAPSANAVLYAGLKDPEPDVRVACCEAWSKRPGPEATRLLAETLSGDTDHDVRMAAVKGLSAAGDKEAVKALAIALEDPDPAMQYCAVDSMRSVTGQDLGNDVKAWRELAKRDDPPLHSKGIAQRVRELF
jgi:HEAT repeat protein